MTATDLDRSLMRVARDIAANGDPIDVEREPMDGALLVKDGAIISEGRSCRYSRSDSVRYAEMDCIANAGRRSDHAQLTLYTTGSPNWLSAGTIVQFGIGALVIGGASDGDALDFLADKGIDIRKVED